MLNSIKNLRASLRQGMDKTEILALLEIGIVLLNDRMEIHEINDFTKDLLVDKACKKFQLKGCSKTSDDLIKSTIKKVYETRKVENIEIQVNTGKLFEIQIKIYEKDDFSGAFIIIKDISSHSLQQYYLDQALLSSRLVWWEWDIANDIFIIHPGDMCILHYPLDECQKITSKTWFKMVHSHDLSEVHETLNHCLKSIEGSWSVEHRFLNRNGDWVWVYNTGNVVNRDKKGQAIYMTGSTQLINDKKILELKNANLLKEARSVVDLKSNFLTTINHELKTPLNPIIGSLDLINLAEELNETKKYTAIAKDAVNKLNHMIQDILDYAELISGELKFSNGVFNIKGLLELVHGKYIKSFEAVNLFLILEETPDFELFSDKELIGKAISNIVDNALKFTKSGGCKISVEESEFADFICITITDTGKGIAEAKIKEIFSDFHQVESGYTRPHEGIGLGLSISKEIIESLGGYISVDGMSKGCSFKIFIPKPNEYLKKGVETKFKKVLIIEEDETNREALKNHLNPISEHVHYTMELALAKTLFRKNIYDLIVLDFQLASGGATDFLNSMKNSTSPVIIYTDNSDSVDTKILKRYNIKDVLNKPASRSVFYSALEKIFL